MSFFRKMFSSNYRDALALEGAGRYREAAESYMLAGERLSVARMHRLSARGLSDPYAKVDALRLAMDFGAELSGPEASKLAADIKGDLAEALVALVEESGLMDRSDCALLEEAAKLYDGLGQHGAAGGVYAKLGHVNRAAEAFERAGDITKMEEMFRRAEQKDAGGSAFDRAHDALEFAEMAGDHVGVVEALEQCVELRPRDASLTARLQTLRERMPSCNRISLSWDRGVPWHLVGGPRVAIGRDEDNEVLLVDASISRRHARLTRVGGEVLLEDLASTHGTWVRGQRVERGVSLAGGGEFRVGKKVELAIASDSSPSGALTIAVNSGHLKGQRFRWGDELRTGSADAHRPEWLPPGLVFQFVRGYWHVSPSQSRGPILVDGEPASNPTLLRLRGELVFGGATVRIE